ncbi:hypothetical protein ASF88_12595 [Leifsonia sp. Leaf336]|uniref:hypothetical protein n=1 Tax=Leifsonia sp. Leaf336 TaxID=1736341 RepID=UPI0006F26B0F|nr:hypothetical protein [Leifsonia sp. Leaf336]KQR52375.1 hypothetical protein ASF88_12595 [Leifsonia sp. Leaf336]
MSREGSAILPGAGLPGTGSRVGRACAERSLSGAGGRMRELARFGGAVAVIALVALATTSGAALSPVRVVDAVVVVVAAVGATACAVVADVRHARERDPEATAHSPG